MAISEPIFPYHGTKTISSLTHPGAHAVVSAGSPYIAVRGITPAATIRRVATPVRAYPHALHAARVAPVAAHVAPVAPVAVKAAHVAPVVAAPAPVAVKAAPVVAAPAPAPAPAVTSSQYHAQDEAGNYEYGYSNQNSAKVERGNIYTGVEGSYSYVDGYGLPQKVSYVADALGFRAVGTNFANTQATSGLRYKREASYALPYANYGLGYNGYATGYAHTGLTYANTAYPGYANTAYAGYASPAPVAHATHAYAGPAAPATRPADLLRIKLNPGHAVAYRVY